MPIDLDLVSPGCDVRRAWGRARGMARKGVPKSQKPEWGHRKARWNCYQQRDPSNTAGPILRCQRVYVRVLGSGSKVFPGKTLYLHTISTANKTMFRCHIPAHSLPCSSSAAYQASSQGTNMQLNWDVLSPCVPWQWLPHRWCHRRRQGTFFSVFVESNSSLSSSFFNLSTLLLWQRTPWRILLESVRCP